MRLLIAEDELDLAEALSVFFEKNHFSVDAVHNGLDAYEYGVTGAYDAIILDAMMPKMDGIQVLERLRSEGVKTPIMMLTAKGQKNDRITGFNAGADDYLPKPFDPDELLSRVRAILRRSEAYQPTLLRCGDPALSSETGKLFDRFYRADPSRSAAGSGFGIGLSIACGIAEGHHGTITAKCTSGLIEFTAELR